MLRRDQCRAARGFLDWSQQDLADAANVSLSTVRDFEKGRRDPISNNLNAIRAAFEQAGLTFTNGDTPCVCRATDQTADAQTPSTTR